MYEELVKRLRAVANADHADRCDGCPYDEDYPCCVDCLDTMLKQAADAIEELLRKEKFHAFLWNVINPNDMQLYLEMYHSGDEKEDAG